MSCVAVVDQIARLFCMKGTCSILTVLLPWEESTALEFLVVSIRARTATHRRDRCVDDADGSLGQGTSKRNWLRRRTPSVQSSAVRWAEVRTTTRRKLAPAESAAGADAVPIAGLLDDQFFGQVAGSELSVRSRPSAASIEFERTSRQPFAHSFSSHRRRA